VPTVFQDIRFGLRALRKNPAFTFVALVTLALGIGANTAIFSVVHTVLLRPLPFDQPDRVVQIWESRQDRGWNRASFTHANFWDFRELNKTFDEIGTYHFESLNLTGYEFPERLRAGRVSAGFFRALGVRPVMGRLFMPDESDPGMGQVVLLSYDLWRTRFAADTSIIGTSIILDDNAHTVVGVVPQGQPWLNYGDVFVPLAHIADPDRVSFEYSVVGRMSSGVTIDVARSDLESVARRLEELYPEENAGIGVDLAPASDWIASDDLRRALWVLFGAVGFLLMIACVNLANMLLARATARQKETAVRAALGAGRSRIVRQVLTESLLLGLIGAGLGVLLAVWMIDLLKTFEPGSIPRVEQIGLDGLVLGFSLVIALLTGVLSGLVPALQAPYSNLIQTLREGDRGVSGNRAQKRLRSGLVAAEVALSLALLVGAGLMIRSFYQLTRVDRGFETENRLVFSVSLPGSYDSERTEDLVRRYLERTAALPQVISVSAVSQRPIAGGSTGMGILPASQPQEPGENVPWASWRLITPEYFRTIGITLVRGRFFSETDEMAAPWTVIISERLAEQLWPGEDPIGKTADLWRGQDGMAAEVIGVVANMRERGLERDPTLAVYLPYYGTGWSPNIVIHTSGDPAAVVPTMQSMLAELDGSLPVSNIQHFEEIVNDNMAGRRFYMLLLALFAAVALFLALAGIYGVQAYSIQRRTSEIGVRVALGARPEQVLNQILKQGMRPALLGVGLGLAGAIALSRLMSSLLFGVTAGDVFTYIAVAILLTATALVSCYLPARRALHVDPVTALREE
jgi:putative ABC transport system permease protein